MSFPYRCLFKESILIFLGKFCCTVLGKKLEVLLFTGDPLIDSFLLMMKAAHIKEILEDLSSVRVFLSCLHFFIEAFFLNTSKYFIQKL